VFVLGAVPAGAAPLPGAAAADASTVNAVWVDHDITFTYSGFTTHYSCDGIGGKVEYVLEQLGARPGYRVTAPGCINSHLEIMPRIRVRAALPKEATPEVMAEIEKNRSKQELAGKAGGKPAAASDAATARFPAPWRVVHFEESPTSDVQDGDCELMEQLLDKVLVPMGVQEVEGSRLTCVPHQIMLGAVDLKVRVLAAPADAAAPKADALR
jgi:hypothetical protein